MNPSQLRLFLAAPLASLFLILCLCAFALRPKTPAGVWLPLATVRTLAPGASFTLSNRYIVISIHRHGETYINATPVTPDELSRDMQLILRNRQERTVYLMAAPECDYGVIVDRISRIQGAADKVALALITRQVRKDFDQCAPGRQCCLRRPNPNDITECLFFGTDSGLAPGVN